MCVPEFVQADLPHRCDLAQPLEQDGDLIGPEQGAVLAGEHEVRRASTGSPSSLASLLIPPPAEHSRRPFVDRHDPSAGLGLRGVQLRAGPRVHDLPTYDDVACVEIDIGPVESNGPAPPHAGERDDVEDGGGPDTVRERSAVATLARPERTLNRTDIGCGPYITCSGPSIWLNPAGATPKAGCGGSTRKVERARRARH